jgi:anti-sigma regulatory factor (Ser/Thr protein kinase)/ActR/RegA family two-component response regulator
MGRARNHREEWIQNSVISIAVGSRVIPGIAFFLENEMSRILVMGCDTQLSHEIGDALSSADFSVVFAAGHADALQRLRLQAFGVIITSPHSVIEEDLALLEEMRVIRPGVRCIILASQGTPDDIIAALRAKVFACFTAPFDLREVVNIAREAGSATQWEGDIEVLSANSGWISLRVNCRLVTADRLMTFEKELNAQLPDDIRLDLMQALREILLNAMEHGARYDPEKVVEVTAVHTARALVFYLRDPGTGFRFESLHHAAISNPPDNPAAHIVQRQKEGMRPGGYGLLMAAATVDELIYNEIGNEVLLIKYMDPHSHARPPDAFAG